MNNFNLTDVEHTLCQQAMSGQSGECLIEKITDHFLLIETTGQEEAYRKEGVARVVKFLRSLNKEENFIKTT